MSRFPVGLFAQADQRTTGKHLTVVSGRRLSRSCNENNREHAHVLTPRSSNDCAKKNLV